MMYSRSKLLPEVLIVTGLALWMSIAWFNNLTDQGTNIIHLENMLSMKLLQDTQFAQGLIWRAWPEGWSPLVLQVILVVQAVVALSLWRAAISYIRCLSSRSTSAATPRRLANYALSLFGGLWLMFLCGGLWFGYWMRQGPIQNVHMTLVLITLATLIFINLPDNTAASND
ncbi:MAG: putative small integral membrane protein [Motiliproteus sp.]|jgi:predicted small integral membrane protein